MWEGEEKEISSFPPEAASTDTDILFLFIMHSKWTESVEWRPSVRWSALHSNSPEKS